MNERLFITATGTDIGKTFVTARLIRELTDAGRTVRALKPVISGYAEGEENDLTQLGADALYRLRAPLSPDMAARLENKVLEYSRIVEFCTQPCAEDVLLIEGIGGVMTPLTEDHTVLDLIMDTQSPVLLVTGSYLGTISHTLTALNVLESRRGTVRAIIVSESAGADNPSLDETIRTLKNFTTSPIMALPRTEGSAMCIARLSGLLK